jgi:hypothetical protein
MLPMALSLLNKTTSQNSLFSQAYIYSKVNQQVQKFYQQIIGNSQDDSELKFFIKYKNRNMLITLTHQSSTILTQLRIQQGILYKFLESMSGAGSEGYNFQVFFKQV